MTMSNYQLVFDGTISDGYQVEDVKKNLAALLKANETQIERLFSKPEVVLKKGMDYDSALQYQKALQKAGTVCKVINTSQNQGMLPVEEAAPVKINDQFIAESPPLPDPNMVNEPMMDGGQVALSQELAAQKFESKASAGSKIGRGMKDIIAGVVLIGIGLVFGGSIFLGTADTLDIFFDCLGLFWIGLGIYKMIR
jgi:hypothetical protein